MQKIIIHRLEGKVVKMIYTGLPFPMPVEVTDKINEYWDGLLSSGRKYTRGEVFTIQDATKYKDGWHVSVALTDYAHYMASRHDLAELGEEYRCKVLHTAVLVETGDGYLVMGRMGDHTSSPGRVQCIGGGITKEDLLADGTLDLAGNAKMELLEEIGFSASNKDHVSSISLEYLKSGGRGYMSAIFMAYTPMTLNDVKAFFEDFNQSLKDKGEIPEFSELVYTDKQDKAIEAFIQTYGDNIDEYVPEMLRAHLVSKLDAAA